MPAQPPAEVTGVRPRVVVLGSGELARELAVALGRLGARVIAVGERADAPRTGWPTSRWWSR